MVFWEKRALLVCCGTLLALAGASSPALAQSSWFHLTSGALPTNIKPGTALSEIQEIDATPEFIAGGLAVGGNFAGLLTAGQESSAVQATLESVYGAGAIEVTGGPVGQHPLIVKSIGPAADRAVPAIEFFGENATLTVLQVGRPDGEIIVTAANLGDAPVNSAETPVTIADTLPADLEAVSIEAFAGAHTVGPGADGPVQCSLVGLTCTYSEGTLPAYSEIEVAIGVVARGAPSGEQDNAASVTGGGAPRAQISRPVEVSDQPTRFGIEDYEMVGEEEGGATDTQAGSHPFQLTTTLNMNEVVGPDGDPAAAGLVKDVHVKWPPGLIGDPTAVERCTLAQFLTLKEGSIRGGTLSRENACPAGSAVGVALSTIHLPGEDFGPGAYTFSDPVFNLEPEHGEPARFGFLLPGVPVYIDPQVRSGTDYGIDVNVNNISQEAAVLRSEVTIWGVPGDSRHNASRGNGCMGPSPAPGACTASAEENEHPAAFLSFPTSCPLNPATHEPQPPQSTITIDSWAAPSTPVGPSEPALMAALDGCNRLPFEPSISVKPDGTAASSPSGLSVDVHIPQAETLNATGLAVADPRNITVALPQGVALNPAGGDGLQACSEGLVGFTGFSEQLAPGSSTATFTPRLAGSVDALNAGEAAPLQPGANFCPNASKIGEVTIHTPVLPDPIVGSVYLASQNANPFGSLIAIYVVAEDPVSGVLIKLAGQVHLGESGQIVSTFENSPQAPFESAEFHFYGGERAPM